MKVLNPYLKQFISLFFPPLCCGCGCPLIYSEDYICTYCYADLPFTGFQAYRENQFSSIFWGRVTVEAGTALCYFHKKGKVQRLIHRFKYRGDTGLGTHLGYLLGSSLLEAPLFKDIDCILPVPLHKEKKRDRGFNQSAFIGQGVSDALSLPCHEDLLLRHSNTSTQTRKARFSRWENVSAAFHIPNPEKLSGKRILLVDDVVTTGATLEACAQLLLTIKDVRVWMATLAITV